MTPRFQPGTFTSIAADLHAVEVHGYDGPVHTRIRMTIVRLTDGRLWLCSPVPLDDALTARVEALGPVGFLVAPNSFHHLHLGAAHARWPEAALWVAPGVVPKHPELPIAGVLGEDEPPWIADVGVELLGGTVPMREAVFCHHASGSLIATDSLFNVQEDESAFTRAFWRLFGVWGRVAQSWAFWAMTRDRAAAAASARRVLAWDFDRLVVAHGDVLDEGAHAAVEAAYGWLLRG